MKRYYVDSHMVPNNNGEYIFFSDHEKALAEKDKEIERLKELGTQAYAQGVDTQKLRDYQCLVNLESRIKTLTDALNKCPQPFCLAREIDKALSEGGKP